MQGSICNTVSEKFRLSAPPMLVLDPYDGAPISVMRIQSPAGSIGRTQPITAQDTFMFGLHLLETPKKQMWAGTTPFTLEAVSRGGVSMLNLQCEPSSYIPYAIDVMTFYIPRATFDSFSDGAGLQRVNELQVRPNRVVQDPVLMLLSPLLIPAMAGGADTSRLFRDHISLALIAHLAHTYGGIKAAVAPLSGGLAPWQVRCAREFMEEHLAGDVSLAAVAGLCGLSVSHFSRAFKISTGQPPHRWLLERRIARARSLLLDTTLSLPEIALACGFADQSHFTRSFHSRVGATPGNWRRTVRQKGSRPH